ncbi:MAG TPA: TonB-dependent receptor [Gemmatimonadaceae bacterium]
MKQLHTWLARAATTIAAVLLTASAAAAQGTGTIEGTVTGANERPLGDVSVSLVGTTRGARTDDAGKYRIAGLTPGAYEVRAQRIGYSSNTQSATVTANQSATTNFTLKEAALSLDALVVTGTAAESRKKEVGNAMATIDTKALEVQPVRNTQDILAGRAPGITVLQNSGQPGAGGTIKLRGTNSVTQGTNPIIYVDGVRIYSENGPITAGARQSSLFANDIKADDIERLEIVKGAAATTLYGTEASGGVIQIFTKKGVSGAPRWTLDMSGGQNFMGHVGPRSDPTGLFINKCSGPELHDAYGAVFVDPTCPSSGTWAHRGDVSRFSLSAAGGGDALTYFVSGNYNGEKGVIGPGQQRDGGARGNFSFSPGKNLQFQINTSYNRKHIQFIPDGNLANGFTLNVMRGPSGNFKGGKGECVNVPTTTVCNTNAYVFDQTITNDADHFISGATLQWSPTVAFTNRFNIGFDYNNSDNKTIIPFGFLNGTAGSINNGTFAHTKLSLDYAGSFRNTFGFLSNAASTFSWGGQVFDDREHFIGVTGADFSGPGDPTLESAARITLGRDTRPRVVNAGVFLQEMLGWRDRLFVTGGLRIDGNSAFGEDFGLQKYPKISASYILSEEGFWPTQWLPTTKLRAAIGESGKAPGAFDAVRTWDPVAGDDGKPGVTVAQVGNPTLGPERTREVELGVDLSGPSERVSLELTAFRARTSGALIGVTLPPSEGFSRTQLENVGLIQNEGIETQLNLSLIRRASLDWSARVNGTWLRNKAIDLGCKTISTGLGSSVRDCYKSNPNDSNEVAKHMPIPGLYGSVITNPDAKNGEAIQVKTDQYIGPVYPTRILGFGSTLTLSKYFTFDAQSELQGGAWLVNFVGYQNANRFVWRDCYDAQQKMRLATVGPDLKAATGDEQPNAINDLDARTRARCAIDRTIQSSDFWAAQTDFFKLRSVSVAWNVPERLIPRARNTTLTLAGRNLFRWTKFDGADPESNDASDAGTGLGRREYYTLPAYKSVILSIRTTF